MKEAVKQRGGTLDQSATTRGRRDYLTYKASLDRSRAVFDGAPAASEGLVSEKQVMRERTRRMGSHFHLAAP